MTRNLATASPQTSHWSFSREPTANDNRGRFLFAPQASAKQESMYLVDVDRIRRIWRKMKAQCRRGTDPRSADYGKSAASLCADWHDFKHFAGWAVVSGYADDLVLDRVNVLGPFEPNNCRWITRAPRQTSPQPQEQDAAPSQLTPEAIAIALASKVAARWPDGDGLILQVSKRGTAKWYIEIPKQDGRLRRSLLGAYPELSLEEARQARRQVTPQQ